MKRNFSFITIQQIVDELKESGVPRANRSTIYRMIREHKNWPLPARTAKNWRRFDRKSAEVFKDLVREAYGLKKV